eukprot:TRINITY_DN6981_c0_g1_i1.p1 TRINITY_DN6981_c0_g1~~TRINITY_DN6981_c0_g1_i1.p1  ORF type:complete len:283 (-),score=93.82 TRINITY_DN6981_c0_g1_i1:84-932(-)
MVSISQVQPEVISQDNQVPKSEKRNRKKASKRESTTDFVEDFYQEIASIRTKLNQINANSREIQSLSQESILPSDAENKDESEGKLGRLCQDSNVLASEVQNFLKETLEENKRMEKKDRDPSELKIRKNAYSNLLGKFMEEMKFFQEVQVECKNRYRNRLERQYRTVGVEITPEELDEAIKDSRSSVFRHEGMKFHSEAKKSLAYVENKHLEILELEESIAELHQMFMDLVLLIESQGEIIEQIGENVEKSVKDTQEGVNQVRKANNLQKTPERNPPILTGK